MIVKLLILKDLYTQKISIYFLSILWFIILTNFFTDGSPVNHVILIAILASFFALSSNGGDNKYFDKESILINSLPCTRKQVVLAKYMSGLMWFGLAAVAVIIYIMLFDMFAPFPTRMIHFSEIIIALCWTYMMISIFYPLLFKTGYYIASVITFGFPVIVIMGIKIIANMMENPNTAFVHEWIAALETNQTLITVTLIAVSVLIVLLSFILSLKIYNKKDLNA